MAFVLLPTRYILCHVTYIKYIFLVEIQLFVKAMSDKDPDPHRSALVWLPGFDSDPELDSH